LSIFHAGKHKVVHPTCRHANWAECDAAFMAWREEQHAISVAREAVRVKAKRADLDRRIAAALTQHAEHPSVWTLPFEELT
jgi:hypothetical protein